MASPSQRPRRDSLPEFDPKIINSAIFKGPKRKRLLKACDACHKSKRRCDGTAPCSNCYFASKGCTYTDASGRSVPAPNAPRPELAAASGSGSASTNTFLQPLGQRDTSAIPPLMSGPHRGPFSGQAASTQETLLNAHISTSRKRPRPQEGHGGVDTNVTTGDAPLNQRRPTSGHPESNTRHPGPFREAQVEDFRTAKEPKSTESHVGADHTVIRELVNLFFAHCHPHRLIIHSPSFLNDLYLNRVPPYLLNAVCALAAPLSRNARVRFTAVRQMGQPFYKAALEVMFDRQQRLIAPLNLATAQALALLESYAIYASGHMEGDFKLFDLAFRVLDELKSHPSSFASDGQSSLNIDVASTSRHAVLAPDPSHNVWLNAVQRECTRRTFWFIHLIELLGLIFTRRKPTHNPWDLRRTVDLIEFENSSRAYHGQDAPINEGKQGDPGTPFRLPCCEADFELAAVSALPEYLSEAAPLERSASEFGHVIRVATILTEIEECNLDYPSAVRMCEEKLEKWTMGLSDHLRYSDDNFTFQLSLWETSSNTSTWCFCFMHILHACCTLALNDIRQRAGQGPNNSYQSALQAVSSIMSGIGSRARNSVLMGIVLWLQHCGPHAPGSDLRSMDGPAIDVDSRYGSKSYSVQNNSVDNHAGGGLQRMANSPNIPELEPKIQGWIKEWEELWGSVEESRAHTVAMIRKAQLATSTGIPVPTQRRVVPDVMIDPLLRNEDPSGTGSNSRTASTSSNGGGSSQQLSSLPSLPSLKASGLLDVVPVDDIMTPASTTQSKPPQLSLSPYPTNSRHHMQSPRPPSRNDHQHNMTMNMGEHNAFNMHDRSRMARMNVPLGSSSRHGQDRRPFPGPNSPLPVAPPDQFGYYPYDIPPSGPQPPNQAPYR